MKLKSAFILIIFAFLVSFLIPAFIVSDVEAKPTASVDKMGDEPGGNDLYDNDGTVYVTLSHSDDAVEAKISWNGTSSSKPGTWQSISVSATSANHYYSSDGKKYCHYKVKDSSDVWSNVDYNYITVDTTPPPAPSPDDGVSGWSTDNTPTFSWSKPNDLSGIDGYSYAVDAQPDNSIDKYSTSVALSKQSDGEHTFYVKAKDNAGNWGNSGSHKFQIDTTPPPVPKGLTVTAVPEGEALDLSWNAVSASEEFIYIIYRGGSYIKGLEDKTTYRDEGLTNGISYTYTITTMDELGNESAHSSPVSGVPKDTVPPVAPSYLQVSDRCLGNSININWDWLIGDKNDITFRLYMDSEFLVEGWGIGAYKTAIIISFLTDSRITDNVLHQFYLTAVDPSRNESFSSNTVSVVTTDQTAPEIPKYVSAEVDSQNRKRIKVSWDYIYWDDYQNDVVYYKIYRRAESEDPFSIDEEDYIGRTQGRETYFYDDFSNQAVDDTFYYAVKAVDEAENVSDFSWPEDPAEMDTILPTSNVDSLPQYVNKIELHWGPTNETSDIVTYTIQVYDEESPGWGSFLKNTTLTSEIYTGQDGHTYRFRSIATDDFGNVETEYTDSGDTWTTLDLSPPVVSISEPQEGEFYNEDKLKTLIIEGNISDSLSGVDINSLQILVYDMAETELWKTLNYNPSDSNWYYNSASGVVKYDVQGLFNHDDRYMIQIKVKDNVGNQGSSVERRFIVDTRPPDIGNISPNRIETLLIPCRNIIPDDPDHLVVRSHVVDNGFAGGGGTITYDPKYYIASGLNEDTAKIFFFKDNEEILNEDPQFLGNEMTFDTGGLDNESRKKILDGFYTIQLYIEDKAGNSAKRKAEIFIDNVVPKIELFKFFSVAETGKTAPEAVVQIIEHPVPDYPYPFFCKPMVSVEVSGRDHVASGERVLNKKRFTRQGFMIESGKVEPVSMNVYWYDENGEYDIFLKTWDAARNDAYKKITEKKLGSLVSDRIKATGIKFGMDVLGVVFVPESTIKIAKEIVTKGYTVYIEGKGIVRYWEDMDTEQKVEEILEIGLKITIDFVGGKYISIPNLIVDGGQFIILQTAQALHDYSVLREEIKNSLYQQIPGTNEENCKIEVYIKNSTLKSTDFPADFPEKSKRGPQQESPLRAFAQSNSVLDLDPPLITFVSAIPEKGSETNVPIVYRLSESAYVNLFIYDEKGVLVRRLDIAEWREGGEDITTRDCWDGKDDSRKFVPDGNYAVVIAAQDNAGNISEFATGVIQGLDNPPFIDYCYTVPYCFLPNESTKIEFELSENADINIEISDIYGEVVKTIEQSSMQGHNSVVWAGTDNNGDPAPAGKYNIEVFAKDLIDMVKNPTKNFTTTIKDFIPPEIFIPEEGDFYGGTLKPNLDIVGIAVEAAQRDDPDTPDIDEADHFKEYRVFYAFDDENPETPLEWQPVPVANPSYDVYTSTTEVGYGLLATLDTTGLESGKYLLKVELTNDKDVVRVSELRSVYIDNIPPEVTDFTAEPFSPNNDFIKDLSNIHYTLKDNFPFDITTSVKIEDPHGKELITLVDEESQSQGAHSLVWNGKDEDGNLVTEEGVYKCKIKATDGLGNATLVESDVIVDNTPPEISNAYASPFVFTPEDMDGFQDITTLYGSISDNLFSEFTFRVEIVEREEGTVVANLADETTQAKNFSFIWDGKNEAGEFVQDGLYYCNITGIDLAGNESTVNVPVTKNRAPSRIDFPEEGVEVGDIVDISGLAVDYVDFKNFILDYASGTFDISNEDGASWMAIPVPVINQAKADPNYPYSNISVIQCNEGILANWNTIGLDDGEYTIRLKVNDYAGDIQKVFTHVMVKNPLYLYNVIPSNEVFSPNGDGIQDTVVVKYALSEEADVSIEVLDSSGTIRKSYFTEKNLPKGEHTITWDGKDNGGEIVEDGKYEIKIVADAIAPDGGRKEAIESIIVNNFQWVPDLTADISSPAEGSDVQTALGIHYTWEAEGTGREYPDQKFDYIITAVGTETLPAGGDNTERVHLHKSWTIDHRSKWGSFDIYLSNPEKYRNRGPVQWGREVIKSEHVDYVRHTAYDDHLHIYAKVYSNFWGDGCYMADYDVWAPEKQISWTRSQSGTGRVNALEGEKLITECNLTAPNNDTRWFLWHNNSNVGAWMKDNKLYATTGVSELWSTVKVPGGDNIFELSISSRTEKIEYIPPISNVRVDCWKVKLLDGKGNENKDIIVESIDFSKGTFVAKLEGNPVPRSLVKIEGTAASPNLEYYRVECGSSDDIYSWTTIKESNRQVINGTLAVWDVTDLKEGAYVVLLTVVDKSGSVKQVYKRVNLNIPLIITYEEPNPNPFSPQYEETKLKFNLSEEARMTVKIKKDITTVKELVSEKLMKLGSNELKWDGRDTEGNIVPDGIYSCDIMATDTDLDINGIPLEQATASIPNIQVKFVNKKLEPLNLMTKPNPFSPDGDGVKDSVNITYNLSERANVRLLIKNSGGIVRTLLDNVEEPQGLQSVNWDGKLADGTAIVPAGKYTCWIEATSLDDSSDMREESVELTLQGVSTGNITAQILEPIADDVVDRTSSNAGTFFTYEAEGTGTKYPEQGFSYTITANGSQPGSDSGSSKKTSKRVSGHRDLQYFDGALWTNQDVHEYTMEHIFSPPFLATPNVNSYSSNGVAAANPWWSSKHKNYCWLYDINRIRIILKTFAFEDMDGDGWHGTSNPTFWWSVSGTIGWSSSQAGSGEVSAVDEQHKYITTSTLKAPNSDTSWSVTNNSDTVITWMEGNKLYARVDITKPGTVIHNWSTGKIYSKNPNLLIFDPNNPDAVPSLHLNVFNVYTQPSDVEFESWQITPLNVDGSVNTDVTIENIDGANGTFDAKLNLKEQRKFLQIGGTAAGSDFKSYTIEYGQGSEPDEWTLIKPSVGPVTDTTLAYWDISRLYGSYTLLLTVEDTAGNVKELKRNIQIGELVTQGISDFAATPYEETHLYFSPDTLPVSIEDDYPLTPEKDALVSAIPIAPEDVPDDPNIVIVGPVFDFKPSGLAFNENFPVTLNSQYTIERLQEMLGDVDPSKLGIYQFYPDGTVEYRPSFVDKETQMVAITAQIPHFSQYIMALDLTPPVIPVLDPIKSPTNERLVKVTGRAEPEATIEIFTNGKSQGKVSTDNEGKFSLAAVELEEGDNLITAIATNKKGISSDAATASVRLDRLTPVLLAVDVSPRIFSPNGDGVDDTLNIIAKLSEPGSVNYTIFDSSGRVILVEKLETEDEDITYFSWDGLTSGGERASDGIYSYHISGIDCAGNRATENSLSNGIIKLDTTPPEILNVSCHPSEFSPDGDGVQDEVSIDYEIKDNLCSSYYLTVRIYDESGNLVRLLKNREPLPLGANRVVWDGSDEIGNIVNDGNYTVRLDFVDAAANQGKEVSITVKLDNASVLDFSKTKVEPESFSPDDNGKQDTCSISYTLLSPGKVTLKIVTPELMTPIKDLIVDRDLDTGSYIMSWDGKDDGGNIVADGIYECKLSAISQAGKESQLALFVNVDNTPPVAKISQPSSDATLNGTIDIEGTVSDENYSGYSLTYGQGTSLEKWTLLFSSSEPVTGSSLASWDTAGLSGTYSIKLRVVDDAGNQAEDKVSFNLDNSEKYIIRLLPTSSNLFSPNEDGVKDELSIIYFLEEDALMGLWVYGENNILRTLLDGTTLQTSGYNGVRWDGRGDNGEILPDGVYSYTLQAESVSEGFKDERLGNAIIDTLSPTVSITSPREGDVIGGTIGIFGTANDIAFSGYRMEYGSGDNPQDWKEIKISANSVTDGLLSYFDTSGLDNGNYMLRLTAEDRAGNRDIAKVSITVNNSPVLARIETPVWGEILGGEIKVFGTAKAPDLDYYQLEYSTDSLTYQPVTGKINTAVNGNLLATWDTSGINGSCSLRLSVQDKSGRSKSTSVSVMIDNTSPVVEIKFPEESATIWGTISIIGTASDENLEKYNLEYRNATLNDSWQAIGTYMAPINDATLGFWNTEGLNDDYLIKLKAIDRANNTNEVVTRITIDNRLPVARIDEPENNSILKGKVDITGGASDPHFDKYTVTYAQGPSFDEWESILISTVPVTNDLLAKWDTTPFDGTYSVRLRIYTRKGKVNEDKIVVFVDNTPPMITDVSANPSIFDPNNSKANFTAISYTLSEDAKVTLSIRDGDERLVRQLVSSSPKAKGINSSVWDGKDDSRATVAYGDYIYEIEASDSAGNLADKIEGTIKLSLDLPPATVITPSGPIYSDGRGNFAPMSYTYTLIGINTDDVSHVARVEFSLDNSDWERYVSPLSFTNEGEHSIKYKSVDTNSNWEDAKEFRVIVDSTPPESHIQISPPQWQEMGNGVLYVGSSTKFNLSATDGGTIPSGVLKREYRINGSDWQEYTGLFNLEVVDGSYTIEYRAIDNVRNVEDNKSLQVILDSSPPASSVVVSEPRYSDDRGVWISSSTLVSLSAEDGSGSGVKFTQYKIDTEGEKIYREPFTLISEGSHVITYRSEDNLGNTETAKSIMLLVDRSPPTADISIWVPKYGTEPVYVSSRTAITLTGQDGAGCGIDKIQYSLDKGETWMVYTSSFTITQNGMVSIQYKSMDRVKNAGEIKTINIFVDNTPPVTTFVPSEPLYEGLYALYAPLSTTYSLSGEDPLISGSASGMAKVEYKIDDGELMEYDEPFPLPAGEHIITYYGTDNVANIEEVRPFEVIVDTTSPHTDVIPSGKLYNDGTNDFAPLFYTYALKAVQGLSGVDHIEFSVDGGNWEIYSNPISFSTGGEHSIRYRAVSNTGNLEEEKQFKVIVDAKPPEVVRLFPADGAYIRVPDIKVVEIRFNEDVTYEGDNWEQGVLISKASTGEQVKGKFSPYDKESCTLKFTSDWEDHTEYKIEVNGHITDRVGNPVEKSTSTFRTLMLKERGGKVEEGEVSLEILPNGLPQDAVIIISKEEDEIVNKIPRPYQSLEKDTLYHIVAYNQDHQEIQQKLNKPMAIKISYGKESKSQTKDSSKVEINGINPKTLKLYWYNPEKERWELVKNSKNNFSVEEVMAQVERFGRYCLMGFIPFGDSLEGLTNYPNPFPAFGKNYTTIQYYLKDDADVAIAIYDLVGNLVKIFEINSGEDGGKGGELNKVEWDGRNGRGDMVANGGYICRVQIDDGKRVKSKIRKILVIK